MNVEIIAMGQFDFLFVDFRSFFVKHFEKISIELSVDRKWLIYLIAAVI